MDSISDTSIKEVSFHFSCLEKTLKLTILSIVLNTRSLHLIIKTKKPKSKEKEWKENKHWPFGRALAHPVLCLQFVNYLPTKKFKQLRNSWSWPSLSLFPQTQFVIKLMSSALTHSLSLDLNRLIWIHTNIKGARALQTLAGLIWILIGRSGGCKRYELVSYLSIGVFAFGSHPTWIRQLAKLFWHHLCTLRNQNVNNIVCCILKNDRNRPNGIDIDGHAICECY